MNYAFFVSNHGFGHVMRQIPIIGELLRRKNKVLLICGEQQINSAVEYLSSSLKISHPNLSDNFNTIIEDTDLGLVLKPGTMICDWKNLKIELAKFESKFSHLIKKYNDILEKHSTEKIIVDIVPWALTLAKIMKIGSYLVTNFTWVEQYVGNIPETLIKPIRKCYEDADKVILLGLSNHYIRKMYPYAESTGFIARKFCSKSIGKIHRKYGGQPIVYFSLGRSVQDLDSPIDVSKMPFNFLCASGINLIGNNVHFLPDLLNNSQNYVAAADVCIIKAGWTTISEALVAGTPMILIERPDIPEDTMSIYQLKSVFGFPSLTVDELRDSDMVLSTIKKLAKKHIKKRNYLNQILDLISS